GDRGRLNGGFPIGGACGCGLGGRCGLGALPLGDGDSVGPTGGGGAPLPFPRRRRRTRRRGRGWLLEEDLLDPVPVGSVATRVVDGATPLVSTHDCLPRAPADSVWREESVRSSPVSRRSEKSAR